MRVTFCDEVYELARKDSRIFAVSADVTHRQFKHFREEFPERFFDTGVAEQNAVGVAAGLCLSGKIPFFSTIATFATTRCYEQIRNDVCYPNLNVKIGGLCSALSYSDLGPTHHSLEDIAVMRALPNMTILVAADRMETRKAVVAAAEHEGPVYIRVGRSEEPDIYQEDYDFQIGKAILLREGNDVTLVGTGLILSEMLKACHELLVQGIEARVINMHTIKPLDKEVILKAATETQAIITMEEHNVVGGLGDAVCQFLAQKGVHTPFETMGFEDVFLGVGTAPELRRKHHLDSSSIVKKTKEILKDK